MGSATDRAEPQIRTPDAKPRRLLIGGRWIEARTGETFPTFNPATGELLAYIAAGGAADIDAAVIAARQAFEGPWRKFKPTERQRILLKLAELIERNADELSLLATLDMGAPLNVTRNFTKLCIARTLWYSGLANGIHGDTIQNSLPGEVLTYTLKEPVGVVGAIIPWNAPQSSTIWKVGPALATGCTLVLKPAEEASLVPLRLAELCLEAGVPEGVLNVVTGLGEVAGAALAAHLGVDKVAFTGSHLTGQKIVAASAGNLKRVSLELGGKSPDIVFADADLEMSVPGAAMAVFNNSGQICHAGTRLFVERPIYDEFVSRVADFGNRLKVGNGIDPETQIGPIVSEQQLQRVMGYLEAGNNEGARTVTGGDRLLDPDHATGYFVPPTVFADVRDDMRIAREEIFGPVLSAIAFDDLEEVAVRANATPFGLGSGVWTRDLRKAHRLAQLIQAGTVWINCYGTIDPAMPFGGYKMSGYGREGGLEQINDYLNVKAVYINTV